MAKQIKILKDECLNTVLRNETLRINIAEALGGIQEQSVRHLARRALKDKVRNKLYDAESLTIIKKWMGFKNINEMYK